MSSVHNAQPGDLFQDEDGQLWLCMSRCDQPTIQMKRMVPVSAEGNEYTEKAPNTQSGGIHGLMWAGFEKVRIEKVAP